MSRQEFTRQELTNELIEATEKLIKQDLIKADVAIGIGCFITVRSKKSMLWVAEAWKHVSKVTVTRIYKEIEVFDDNKELIDILDGEFIGYQLFADIR